MNWDQRQADTRDIQSFAILEGLCFAFYGVDGNCFALDGHVYEAVENEDDGWRSYLDSVRVDPGIHLFFSAPLATVRIEHYNALCHGTLYNDRDRGFRLIDTQDEHVWLEVGTDLYNSWYPLFVFRYHPKINPKEVKEP